MYRRWAYVFILLLLVSCASKRNGGLDESSLDPDSGDQRSSIKEPDLFDTSVRNIAPDPSFSLQCSSAEITDATAKLNPNECFEGDEVSVQVEANDVDSNRFTYMYDWDGNGVFDEVTSNPRLRHIWRQDGVYKLKIRVQDEHGGVGEVQVRLTIKDRGPQAKMVISGVRSEGEWLKFDATDSTSPTDPLVKYEWDWNYNGKLFHVAPTAGSLVENRWMKDGHYEVALRVTDADGSTSLSSQMLNIVDQAPVARIVGPDELIAGETATFSAQDSRSSVDAITGYFWDVDYHTEFKPLYKESRAVITYAWKEAGVYRLALEVQDADGSRTQTTHEVRVKLPKILEKTTSKKSGGK